MSEKEIGLFKAGVPGPGRPKGSRNKLQHTFVNALEKDFHEHGEGVIRIVRIERPHEYLKIIAQVIPKEFVITDGEMDNMSDEDLMDALKAVREARREKSRYDS